MALHLKLKPYSHPSLRLLYSSSSSSSSYSSDIKQRLDSPPSPPLHSPPPPPPSLFADKSEKPSVTLAEIRKPLASFGLRPLSTLSSSPTRSQEPLQPNERKGEEGEKGRLTNQFLKVYTYQELGQKLVTLRVEKGEKEKKKTKKQGFSLNELNQRLVELRKLDKAQIKSRDGPFAALRESLYNIQISEESKKKNMLLLEIKPPQEHLLEKYFHIDHMSSADKMKLKLKKVRDEFNMSESDCGSARVQVTQLATKIEHLSTVMHKKDKLSRKRLQGMLMSISTNLGGDRQMFMLKSPQEQLLEKYFHPDDMSIAEKMKLVLEKVRDELRMSAS